ncbi:hypothetical protein GW916_10915 [bacterium]|nr:hypothetical protein [bacterium]
MINNIEAARVLYRYGKKDDATSILRHTWENPENQSQAFEAFLGLMEAWIAQDKESTQLHLEEMVSGYGPNAEFWNECSLSEQSIIFEWLGQIQIQTDNRQSAFESLSRAASLGRDTSLLWRLLGDCCIDRQELDLTIRYLKRSLSLYRQLDLDVLSGRNFAMGSFTGKDPLSWSHGANDFLHILLKVTKVAKGKRNLKAARELLMEMLHQFPNDDRLPKLRLMIERSIVEHSLFEPESRQAQLTR